MVSQQAFEAAKALRKMGGVGAELDAVLKFVDNCETLGLQPKAEEVAKLEKDHAELRQKYELATELLGTARGANLVLNAKFGELEKENRSLTRLLEEAQRTEPDENEEPRREAAAEESTAMVKHLRRVNEALEENISILDASNLKLRNQLQQLMKESKGEAAAEGSAPA